MKKVITIFMERDGMTYEEAKKEYETCRAEFLEAVDTGDIYLPEEVLMTYGLEPDYVFDFI